LNKKYNNLIIFLVALVVVLIVISYLKNLNVQEKTDLGGETTVQKSCGETCKTEACLYGCYSSTINLAVAEGNIDRCNEIKSDATKQSCLDQVNLALKNCNKIVNQGLRELC